MARPELYIAKVARPMGVTGWVSQVERIRRRVEVAERKHEWWRKEKAKREGERSPPNAIMTSAVDANPFTAKTPSSPRTAHIR